MRSGASLLALALVAGCAEQTVTLPPPPESPAERAVAQRGDTWLTIGKRLLAAREHELALEAFERSLVVDGPSAEAMTGAGLAAENQGLLTMAARYFEHARDLAPDSVGAHNNLGVVKFRLGEHYQARQAFQTAFALSDGQNPLAMRNLRLSEEIIAEQEAERRPTDPAINFRVDRRGSSEFKLTALKPPEERTVAVEAEPAAPEMGMLDALP